MSGDVEAVQACLRDDAATLRDDNKECEIAFNMDAAATLIGRLAAELAAANEAREKAERERDVLRNCQFHNENELRRADAEIGTLRAEVERLREQVREMTIPADFQRILHENRESLYADDAAIDAARKGA